MDNAIKRHVWTALCAVLFLALFISPAAATSYTLYATSDGSESPGAADFARFVDATTGATLKTVTAADALTFTSAAAIRSYATTNSLTNWKLLSAGTYTDAQSETGLRLYLPAAHYRIWVDNSTSAFTYDSYNWSSDYGYWVWFLNVYSSTGACYTLGDSRRRYTSVADAINAVKGDYLDITLTSPGYLSFWIWDNNSLDNSGSITFNIAHMPLPSSLLLLLTGTPLLIRSVRQRFFG